MAFHAAFWLASEIADGATDGAEPVVTRGSPWFSWSHRFTAATRPESFANAVPRLANSLSSTASEPRSRESAVASLVASLNCSLHLRAACVAINAETAAATASRVKITKFIATPTVVTV